ncbi:MAG: ImmA/IrrE family metallo-endopeptidase [Verrucomicrobia bacterium]|nr:ImmA/IrrE family metallo-endopeptidase [Verrucomicrobiota bacterium]
MKRAVVAQRVKEAREGCGLNQTELAHRLGWKSHASIVAIEQGEKELKMWELLKIAEVLNIAPESLYGEQPIGPLSSPQILWRQKGAQSEAVCQEERHIYQHCEDYRLLEKLVVQPSFPLRELSKRDFNVQTANFDTVNRLADELHRELNLGDYPAEVLARRLEEDFGVILLSRPLENGSAACLRSGSDIVIVTNKNDVPWRQVFSLAHELFHIVTWSDSLIQAVQSNAALFQKNEQWADAFAGALLMPQQMIERDVYGRKLSYSVVVVMARKYGVSTQAMLWRLCHLRFLTVNAVQATLEDREFNEFDRSTYKEAFESAPSFGNRFLRLAYLVFESGKISKSRLARMLGVNLRDLEQYLSTNGFTLTDDKEIASCIG